MIAGIIAGLKRAYRTRMLSLVLRQPAHISSAVVASGQRCLLSGHTASVLDALCLLSHAWTNMSADAIRNCWFHSTLVARPAESIGSAFAAQQGDSLARPNLQSLQGTGTKNAARVARSCLPADFIASASALDDEEVAAWLRSDDVQSISHIERLCLRAAARAVANDTNHDDADGSAKSDEVIVIDDSDDDDDDEGHALVNAVGPAMGDITQADESISAAITLLTLERLLARGATQPDVRMAAVSLRRILTSNGLDEARRQVISVTSTHQAKISQLSS